MRTRRDKINGAPRKQDEDDEEEEDLLTEDRLAEESERQRRCQTIKTIVESYVQSEGSAFHQKGVVEVQSIKTDDDGGYSIKLEGMSGSLRQLKRCRDEVPRALGSCYTFRMKDRKSQTIRFRPKSTAQITRAMVSTVLLVLVIVCSLWVVVTSGRALSEYIADRETPWENIRAAALLTTMQCIGVSS